MLLLSSPRSTRDDTSLHLGFVIPMGAGTAAAEPDVEAAPPFVIPPPLVIPPPFSPAPEAGTPP